MASTDDVFNSSDQTKVMRDRCNFMQLTNRQAGKEYTKTNPWRYKPVLKEVRFRIFDPKEDKRPFKQLCDKIPELFVNWLKGDSDGDANTKIFTYCELSCTKGTNSFSPNGVRLGVMVHEKVSSCMYKMHLLCSRKSASVGKLLFEHLLEIIMSSSYEMNQIIIEIDSVNSIHVRRFYLNLGFVDVGLRIAEGAGLTDTTYDVSIYQKDYENIKDKSAEPDAFLVTKAYVYRMHYIVTEESAFKLLYLN